MNSSGESLRNDAPRGGRIASTSSSPSSPASQQIISGIDLIDSNGGLHGEKAYVVKGPIGVGKTIFGLQFLSRGLELQEPGILVTNQKPENVLQQARSIGFKLDEAVQRGQLLILNTSNRYFELVETPADVMAIVDELRDYIQNNGVQRLVIDPVYSLITTSYSSHFAVTVAQSLLNAIEDLPVTTLLIAGDEDNPEYNPIIRVLEQNASGVVALDNDRSTGGRIMRLSKFRYGSNEHSAAHYRILNGRGVINYQGEGETVRDVTQMWEESEGARRTVMVLGANPETIRKVREALGDGFQVSAESDFRTGLEKIQQEKPGLVLVTPSRSLQSLNAILELSRNSSSSIAFLSPATNRATDKVFYLRAGADDFITEPFSPLELRARAEALVRRSGRRLTHDSSTASVSQDEMNLLLQGDSGAGIARKSELLKPVAGGVQFDPAFRERLLRNIDTVAKFDLNFALYWLKSNDTDGATAKTLAALCRQEDIICRNTRGEFVALLTGTDENGVRGFETRLREKLGRTFEGARHGYALYTPGESVDEFTSKAVAASA